MSTYIKHKTNDFTNGLDTGLLHTKIKENLNIGDYLVGINTDDDRLEDVDIIFSQSLTPEELIELNGIINIHIPVAIKNIIARIYPEQRKIKDSSYTFIGRFNSLSKGSIIGIDVLCYIDKKAEGLEIDFVSRSNNSSIAYGMFTNQSAQNNTITPTSEANSEIIDIFARVSRKKKKGYIDEIIIWN